MWNALWPDWCAANPTRAAWRLALANENGAVAELTSEALPAPAITGAGDKRRFRWSAQHPVRSVEIAARRLAHGLTGCTLTAHLTDGWRVVRADFPLWKDLAQKPGLKLAAPWGWGIEYDLNSGGRWEATYPSGAMAMQFVALYTPVGDGLYIALHDPQAHHKWMQVVGAADRVELTATHWPADAPLPTYRMPYEVVIGPVRGGWMEAAQRYRSFALRAAWSQAGPTHRRKLPTWLTDTEVWLIPAMTPMENVDVAGQAADRLGVPVSLHWYNWHEIPFDSTYPDYFPARPRFADGVKALQQAGLRVMPYINGRLCHEESRSWTTARLQTASCLGPDGQPYRERYNPQHEQRVMCPYAAPWQQMIQKLVHRLVHQCGVDAVYIDQICAAAPVRCYDASHGHPTGGGAFWVDGYRQMLAQIRQILPPERILTTEENAECWLDQLDALLLVNTPPNQGRVIPLFPAVYSGYTVTFGFQYIAHDDLKRSLPFRFKMARAFIWGAQLGWIDAGILLAPEHAAETELLRNLAHCRRSAHDWLLYGQFAGEAQFAGEIPPLTGSGTASWGGDYTIDTPGSIAAWWESPRRQPGLAVVNMADTAVTGTVAIPDRWVNTRRGRRPVVLGCPACAATRVDANHLRVQIPSRSGAVVTL